MSLEAIGRGATQVPAFATSKICDSLKILFTDLLPANLTCILPNALSWAYRTLWTGSVQSCTLTVRGSTAERTAHLFTHSLKAPKQPNAPTPAILLLHGDHGHPLSTLHLADIAEAQGRAVFSVHLPYDDNHPEAHRLLLKKSIDQIGEMIAEKGGRLSHLLLAGHSRGALEAANEAFDNPKVDGVIVIAGRFKVIKPSSRPCRPSLEPSVDAVWEKLRNPSRSLRIPFRQIAANNDWCIDPEASIVRPDQSHLRVDAGHLGVINHPDTLRQFHTWVAV